MPATTATNFQNLILMEIGEPLTGGPIAPVMSTLWGMFGDKSLIAPRLQYLYVLAKAFDVKIGAIQDGAYMAVGQVQSEKLDDKVPGYMKQRDAALLAAQTLERQYAKLRKPVTGVLTTTAPIGPADDYRTVGALDGNSREYRGDLYFDRYIGGTRII
ncbi:MAG: hypothetical protein H0X33_13155 [Taibaiella sp.]|nr:hypothetical protein [Taibaiella sp.]